MVRIQLQGYFRLVRTTRMLGYGTTSTASWPCGGWGWLIARTQTGMRIRPKPTNSSRYFKVWCKPARCLGFFSYGSGLEWCVHIAAVSRSGRVFPARSTCLVPIAVSVRAAHGVQCSWQPSSKQDVENCGREADIWIKIQTKQIHLGIKLPLVGWLLKIRLLRDFVPRFTSFWLNLEIPYEMHYGAENQTQVTWIPG